jgi:hypothetical protein
MSYGNNYGNNGYDNPQGGNQDQGQREEGFWPNVTGFKIGPNQKGTGHSISFTVNAVSQSKSQPITFEEFMQKIEEAFKESGGQGVRIVLPFREGNGPRGRFQSATIGIFPNVRPQQSFGGGGGGRRSYPSQQSQGYGQPQQNYAPAPQQRAQRSAPAQAPAAPAPAQPAPARTTRTKAPKQDVADKPVEVDGEPIPF